MSKLSILFFGLLFSTIIFSCQNNEKNESKSSKEVTEVIKKPQAKVSNQVQVGDSTLSYKVSLGVLPDLAYKGKGMKAAKVNKGRPGYIGGLKDGDIVVEIDGKLVNDLFEYTKLLGTFEKGQGVVLTVLRGEKKIKANIVFD